MLYNSFIVKTLHEPCWFWTYFSNILHLLKYQGHRLSVHTGHIVTLLSIAINKINALEFSISLLVIRRALLPQLKLVRCRHSCTLHTRQMPRLLYIAIRLGLPAGSLVLSVIADEAPYILCFSVVVMGNFNGARHWRLVAPADQWAPL